MHPCDTAPPSNQGMFVPWSPDDAPARPLAQLRVRARLEGVRAENRRRRPELGDHVERAERRLHTGRAHGDAGAKLELAGSAQLEAPLAPVDHDLLANRLELEARGRNPAGAPVRPTRQADPIPGRRPVAISADADCEHDAGPEVAAKLGEQRHPHRALVRLRADSDLRPADVPCRREPACSRLCSRFSPEGEKREREAGDEASP